MQATRKKKCNKRKSRSKFQLLSEAFLWRTQLKQCLGILGFEIHLSKTRYMKHIFKESC
uniref:Uncharacterized protein n=1 Tax=Musa acuminata subsp. malaccensis TaxID=214687 RepID=A0A804JSN0_MUSAM